MARSNYTSSQMVAGDNTLGGGLNSTAGNLQLENNESSDLQNIDFDKFGSIMQRNGYTCLNTSAIAAEASDGLHWFEYNNSGTVTRHLVNVIDGKFYKMDDLDGTWDNVTGAVTITAGNHFDFENFLNELYFTNGVNPPLKWTGSGNAAAMTVPATLTTAKFVKQFNNYLFLANVTVGGTTYPSRIYWSTIKDTGTWDSADWIEVSMNDGQEITGIKVLNDRLVIFKNRSVYNLQFTGDADIPFILPGGGKANSAVGCSAPWSIQEVENGLVFVSYDGIYFYDGNNSYKISMRVQNTIDDYVRTRFSSVVSCVQRNKNRVLFAFSYSGSTTNNRIIMWDYFLNSFSVYVGINASAMATAYESGVTEQPYFSDYLGYVYTMDTGDSDYPANVETAIDAYYYTNWRHMGDLISKKGMIQTSIFHRVEDSVLTFAYSYDFETADQFSITMSLATGTSVYGTGVYGTAIYAGKGGGVIRKDITGRGRVVRYKFSNSVVGEGFKVDGFGIMYQSETNV